MTATNAMFRMSTATWRHARQLNGEDSVAKKLRKSQARKRPTNHGGGKGQKDLHNISAPAYNPSTAKAKMEGTEENTCSGTSHIAGTNNSCADTLSREFTGPAGSSDSDAEFGMSDLSLASDEESASDDDGGSFPTTTR
jgi:hypothetical protein